MTPREQQLESALSRILDAIWQSRLWAEPNYPREVHEATVEAAKLFNRSEVREAPLHLKVTPHRDTQ